MLTAIGQNNINFKSIPVGTISFEQKGMFLNRRLSLALLRLEIDNAKDKQTVMALQKSWNAYDVKDKIAADFCEGFLNSSKDSDFYVLETQDKRKPPRRIVGLLQMQGNTMVNLRVANRYTKVRLFRRIKGLGEVLFAQAANIVQLKKIRLFGI